MGILEVVEFRGEVNTRSMSLPWDERPLLPDIVVSLRDWKQERRLPSPRWGFWLFLLRPADSDFTKSSRKEARQATMIAATDQHIISEFIWGSGVWTYQQPCQYYSTCRARWCRFGVWSSSPKQRAVLKRWWQWLSMRRDPWELASVPRRCEYSTSLR